MKLRTKARHLALKGLYQVFLVGTPLDEALEVVRRVDGETGTRVTTYAHELALGVTIRSGELDAVLRPCVTAKWDYDRLGLLERCILRMGAFELLQTPDVPCRVALDEAVELAKVYIGPEAARLVNGILHRLSTDSSAESTKAGPAPAPPAPPEAPETPGGGQS